MIVTDLNYVERQDGGYRVRGTRVSLDSVVYRFFEGLSPESIQSDCFPTLTLEQVYGAITFYLANRAEVDAYLLQADEQFEAFRRRVREEYPETHRRLDAILQPSQIAQ
jgi:uncharacterized protein (DUF433 family)